MNKFEKLGLPARLAEALDRQGFTCPTPIQEKAIPLLLQNPEADFIGLAQTGTGKTAAFGLPLLELVQAGRKAVQALIMAPTRELAQQTAAQLRNFARPGIQVEVVYGGAAMGPQIRALRQSPQVVVATPGRLIDLLGRQALRLDEVRYLVLDEADEMLNMGFKEDIDRILTYTTGRRAIWLFSATMPSTIRTIVRQYMTRPLEVAVNTASRSNADIEHQYMIVPGRDKLTALHRLLEVNPAMHGVLFCRTRRETRDLARELGSLGVGVEALHGELSQGQRDRVMRRFKARAFQLLVATDVAARGIDVDNLTHVIHYSMPDQLTAYTHRSGRTGRAGNKGVSLVLVQSREVRQIKALERKNRISFRQVELPGREELQERRLRSWLKALPNGEALAAVDGQMVAHAATALQEYSREELIRMLLHDKLALPEIPVQAGRQQDGRSGKERKATDMARYRINVGLADGLNRGDLLQFLADISRIKRKQFGRIVLGRNSSEFEVRTGRHLDLPASFRGLEVDGRQLLVQPAGTASRLAAAEAAA